MDDAPDRNAPPAPPTAPRSDPSPTGGERGGDRLTLIATATFGLEAVVVRELASLGYEGRIVQNGRVEFAADAAAVCRCNLWLRSADRVLVLLGRFPAPDFDALFAGAQALPWEHWIPPEGAIPVRGRSVRSRLTSVPACQRTVKKAIVERLRRAHGVQTLPESGAACLAEVALLNDEATLTLDSTGPGLHKRGYRVAGGAAPLKETLAAGLVQLSFWRPERPLLDPFCGTGTIVIEAASIARNQAPGARRAFAAESWPAIDTRWWRRAREEARDLERDPAEASIVGTDRDARALRAARENAEAAGVAGALHLQQRPFAELASRGRFGCLITNPPYGHRSSRGAEVEELYRSMPMVLRRLKSWSIYVLTAWPDFEQILGQEADRRRKLYNGRLACTYYQFHGPRPPRVAASTPGAIARAPDAAARAAPARPVVAAATGPAFGGISAHGREQAKMFAARLVKRERHLQRWARREGIECYRIYERDIPEVPLVVDRYGACLHIGEYERPHERTPAEHADWLDLMAQAAAAALSVAGERVFVKRRLRQRGRRQHERQAQAGAVFDVAEGGLRFAVNLSDYIDTGLFLDHRITRAMVRDAAAGKRFLNLFGYTGTFSVYAAAGGARRTTTVDLSATYLRWARDNMGRNGFADERHRFIRADALRWLEAQRRGPRYDLVVVDPPTFSNSKMADQDWDVQRGHVALLRGVLELCAPESVVYFSTNARRFRFDLAADLGDVEIREITAQTVPPDFRNRRAHRCWTLRRRP